MYIMFIKNVFFPDKHIRKKEKNIVPMSVLHVCVNKAKPLQRILTKFN